MASNCARKVVQRSTSSAKSLLFRAQSSNSAALLSTIRVSPRRRSFFFFSSSSRLPVELGCGESLMPLHSVTASALLNSMLSCKVGQWGFLSEGFFDPAITGPFEVLSVKFHE